MDIDVSITGPDSKVIHNGERESNGRYEFAAHIEGQYNFCLSNKMSTMTPKVLFATLVLLHDFIIQDCYVRY